MVFEQKRRQNFEKYSLENLIENALKITTLMGINIDEKPHYDWGLNTFRTIFIISILIYVFHMGPAIYYITIVRPKGDPVARIQNLCIISAGQMVIDKVVWILLYRKKIWKVVVLARALDTGTTRSASITRGLRRIRRRCIAFAGAIYLAALFYLTTPILERQYRLPDEAIILLGLEPMNESPNFEISYTIMVLANCFSTLVAIGYEILFIIFLGYAAIQLDALGEDFKDISNVKETVNENDLVEIHSYMRDAYSNMNNTNQKVPKDILKKRISKLVERHSEIIEFVRQLRNTFKGVIGYDFAIVMISLCALLMETKRLDTSFLASLTIYFFMQLLVYCLLGQELIDASNSFENAVIDCGWESFAASEMKAIHIILSSAQKPLKLTAADMCSLTYASFMSILQSVYSAYTTLSRANT